MGLLAVMFSCCGCRDRPRRAADILSSCGAFGVLHVHVARVLLPPSPRIIDLSLWFVRGRRPPPPQLRLACHSTHFWSRTNQAEEETRPAAAHM